jgi:hypothetical protein
MPSPLTKREWSVASILGRPLEREIRKEPTRQVSLSVDPPNMSSGKRGISARERPDFDDDPADYNPQELHQRH